MKFQSGCSKWLLAFALFLAGTTSAFAEDPADDAAQAGPADFTITSATKDKTHPYYGKGSDTGFVVNDVQGGSLVLVRGKTYTFDVETGVMHDFYLATKGVGWGASTLTEGVKGNFTYKGIVTFTPTAETPDTVYYACRNHKYMGGEIHIVNPGQESKFKGVKSALAH